jgi:hypothetical protein
MEDLSLHILDVAENSVNAGATFIQISIAENTVQDLLILTIEDNGRGMPAEFVQKVLDPFCTTRTTRKVGLGLSLLAQSARETGGDIRIQSFPDKGTVVTADFRPSHIDMKPLGNIADTITTLIAGNPETDFLFRYDQDNRNYSLDTREIRAALEEVPINSADVLSAIRGDLLEALHDL